MPRDRDSEFKKRHAEEREALEQQEAQEKEWGDKVRELLEKAEPLMDQVDNSYRMYSTGVERLPPNEKRRMLDQMFFQLQNLNKPTMTLKFMADQARSRYVTMKERWDRLMKDIENGKLKLKRKSG